MLKKVVCLVLCLLMLLPVLVACKEEDAISEIIDEASKSTCTLNVWLMAEPDMDMAQAEKVAEAINKLTKAKYKTKLNFKFFSEAEYYDAVEAAFAWEDANQDKRITIGDTGTKGYLNDYGMVELSYPEIAENEVDILFIGSFEKYSSYINSGRLALLDNQIQEHQELSATVNPTLLTAARYDKQIYAIPNNHGAGHYTYLEVRTDLLEEYAEFRQGTTLYDTAFQNFLDYIYRTYSDPAEKIYPLYSADGTIDLDFYHYWNFAVDDSGAVTAEVETFSLFGDSYPGKTQLGNVNLLADRDYMRSLATKAYYETTEGYITTDADAAYAVRVVKGDLAEKQKAEADGYTVLLMEGPTLRNEDVYASMFAVGANTVSVKRSMEIIACFNTDEEIRNLLQYGIRDVNYTLSTTRIDGLEYPYVTILAGNGYHMDIAKTGNQFLAYPVGIENAQQWTAAKVQNLELAKDPCLGVHLTQKNYKLNLKNVRVINAVSAAVKTYLDTLQTPSQIMALYGTVTGFAADNAGMAACLLEITGPVSYTENGVATAVTVEDLTAALTAYQQTERPSSRNQQYAPYQLYVEWCVSAGITAE